MPMLRSPPKLQMTATSMTATNSRLKLRKTLKDIQPPTCPTRLAQFLSFAAARSRPPSYRSVSPPRYSHTATQPVVTPLAVEPIAEEDIEEQPPTASDGNASTKQDRRRCRFRISSGCRGCVSWLCSSEFWFPFCFIVW